MKKVIGKVEDLGVPVQAVVAVGPVIGEDENGKPSAYTTMGEGADPLFVLQVNPENGNFRQYFAPEGIIGGRPFLWSKKHKKLYVAGGGKRSCLLCFDPKKKKLENLGWIDKDIFDSPVSIAESPSGDIYLGGYLKCNLLRYDVKKKKFINCGLMDEKDQYLYVKCGDDGTVACLIKMSYPHVVAYDPITGIHKAVGPVADKNLGRGYVDLFKGNDGNLYINCHEGFYRLQKTSIVKVEKLPEPMPAKAVLPDGSICRFADDFASYKAIHREFGVISPDGKSRKFYINWKYGGTEIYIVRTGPDKKIYGSSILPLHFFEYNPNTGKIKDYGSCCTSSGEIYSMDCLNEKLYFCAYTHAILGVYDPSKPWKFGRGTYKDGVRLRFGEKDDNPRQLGRIDTVAYRPRDMLCGPGGKVWVASLPDYGMWGGTLSWYDPAKDEFGGMHRNIYPECSPAALTYIPDKDLIAIGFIIYGGSGTKPRAERAGFALWDPNRDREVRKGDCGLEIVGVMDMEYAGNGLVYAIVHTRPEHVLVAHLLLLDLEQNKVVKHTRLDTIAGWPLEVSFQRDQEYVYGATRNSIYRIPIGTVDVDVIWQGKKDFPTCGGALLNNKYYFGAGTRLKSVVVK